MSRIYTRHIKKFQKGRLVRVMTLAYMIEHSEISSVVFSAVTWKWDKNVKNDHWNRCLARKWAIERLRAFPIYMTFLHLNKNTNIGYYQYRRLENALLQVIYTNGVNTNGERVIYHGPDSVFDPKLSPEEAARHRIFEMQFVTTNRESPTQVGRLFQNTDTTVTSTTGTTTSANEAKESTSHQPYSYIGMIRRLLGLDYSQW